MQSSKRNSIFEKSQKDIDRNMQIIHKKALDDSKSGLETGRLTTNIKTEPEVS